MLVDSISRRSGSIESLSAILTSSSGRLPAVVVQSLRASLCEIGKMDDNTAIGIVFGFGVSFLVFFLTLLVRVGVMCDDDGSL